MINENAVKPNEIKPESLLAKSFMYHYDIKKWWKKILKSLGIASHIPV